MPLGTFSRSGKGNPVLGTKVEVVGSAAGVGSSSNVQTITVPSHFEGDLIVAVCGADSSTVPVLPSGWTSIHSATNSGAATLRSLRVFYIYSPGTLTSVAISTTSASGACRSGCTIFRNAFIGNTTTYTSTAVDALSRPLNTLTLQNQTGNSVILGSVHQDIMSSVVAGGAEMTLGPVGSSGGSIQATTTAAAFPTTSVNVSTSTGRITSSVEIIPYAPLERITAAAKSTCVAAYGFRRLSLTWTGPVARVRRSSDDARQDFTSGGFASGEFSTWLGASTGYVSVLYDQSGNKRHLVQNTLASQPQIFTTGNARYIRFATGQNLIITSNIFGATTVSDMHWVSVTRENTRQQSYIVSLASTGLLKVHAPWEDGVWYFDGGNDTTFRAQSYAGITAAGAISVFSGYKSTAINKVAFRLNGGSTFVSSSNGAATANRITIGANAYTLTGTGPDFFTLALFSARLPLADEIILETALLTPHS